MLICKDCGNEWSGLKWERKGRVGQFDYRCSCGSKKKPVEPVEQLKKLNAVKIGKPKANRLYIPTEDDLKYLNHTTVEMLRLLDNNTAGPMDYREPFPELPKENRVLVIPDLHLPFPKEGYLDFLKSIYDKYDCNTVIQMGDLIDGHYESRHPTDPHAMNAEDEFDAIIPYIREIAETFPVMKVLRGNHCRIVERATVGNNISSKWLKSLKDRLLDEGLPVDEWEFAEHFIIDGVKYVHGEGRKAKGRMLQDGISIVGGHYHAESYVHWHVNDYQKLFAMQLGALIQDEAYAFAYGKHFAKSHKNCGVVINGVPTIEYMEL